MKCSWQNKDNIHCQSEAKHALTSQSDELFDGAMIRGDVPKILAYYVMAQGGPAKAAERM